MIKNYNLKLVNIDIETMYLKFKIYIKNDIDFHLNYSGDLFVKFDDSFNLTNLKDFANVNIQYLINHITNNPKDYYIDLNRIYVGPLSLSIDSIDDYIKYINNETITSDLYEHEKLKSIYYFDFIIKEFIER